MTTPGWAERAVDRTQVKKNELDVEFIARLLKAEHARAVRIVKKVHQAANGSQPWCDTVEKLESYLRACNDVLAALQRGRG